MGDPVFTFEVVDEQSSGPYVVSALGEPPRDGTNRLRLTFRKRDGIALIVSSVVGVGIFTTPAIVASLVPNPTAMLTLWLVGGLLALAGATSYARLAKLWPSAGGEYVYLTKAYGPAAGFLSGWTSLIAAFSGSVAASAVALTIFAGQYFPSLAANRSLISTTVLGVGITLPPRIVAAAFLITLFAVLHICSLGGGRITQNTLAVLLVGMIVVFVARGFATGNGSWSHFHSSGGSVGAVNWLLALIPIMFTYSGWNAAAYISEELHAGRRSMRPVLLAGTCIVIILYTILNALFIYALPVDQMRSASNVADAASRTLFKPGMQLVTPALMVALLGAISALTIAGPRVYYAMARDGAFIRAFVHTSPKFGTPSFAIALQAMWSIALVMLGGFDQILMYTGFAIVLSSGAAVAGLFVVQHKNRSAAATARRQLIVPGIFVLASAALVIDTVLEAPRIAFIGALLIAAGLPVYFACRRSNSIRLASPQALQAAVLPSIPSSENAAGD